MPLYTFISEMNYQFNHKYLIKMKLKSQPTPFFFVLFCYIIRVSSSVSILSKEKFFLLNFKLICTSLGSGQKYYKSLFYHSEPDFLYIFFPFCHKHLKNSYSVSGIILYSVEEKEKLFFFSIMLPSIIAIIGHR